MCVEEGGREEKRWRDVGGERERERERGVGLYHQTVFYKRESLSVREGHGERERQREHCLCDSVVSVIVRKHVLIESVLCVF